MADIRDEHGRPIQLTDEFGRPVQLTDEHGVPMHLTGVATTVGPTIGSELHDDQKTHFAPTPIDYAKHTQTHGVGSDKKELERSTSSSSSSSEDDGQGGRRKKKGLMQKIKEKLPGHNNEKDKATTAHSTDTKVRVEQEHEKKGFMDKIKDKLPGHH